MKKWLLPALATVVCALVAFALFANQRPQAAAFSLPDLNQQTVSNQQLQGKVTLINFWYPSCPGCVIEMPKLVSTQHKFANSHYQTIAISLPFNTEAEVRAYVQAQQLPFTIAIDKTGAVGEAYKVQLAPNSFLVDKNGKVVKAYLGEPDWDELHRLIAQELQS
mgnify:CR=1 FL=1